MRCPVDILFGFAVEFYKINANVIAFRPIAKHTDKGTCTDHLFALLALCYILTGARHDLVPLSSSVLLSSRLACDFDCLFFRCLDVTEQCRRLVVLCFSEFRTGRPESPDKAGREATKRIFFTTVDLVAMCNESKIVLAAGCRRVSLCFEISNLNSDFWQHDKDEDEALHVVSQIEKVLSSQLSSLTSTLVATHVDQNSIYVALLDEQQLAFGANLVELCDTEIC